VKKRAHLITTSPRCQGFPCRCFITLLSCTNCGWEYNARLASLHRYPVSYIEYTAERRHWTSTLVLALLAFIAFASQDETRTQKTVV